MRDIPNSHLTILCDDVKELALDEAVMEGHDSRMVKVAQKTSLMHGVNRFIGLQVSNWNLLQNFSAKDGKLG